jgi:hypothetical protein
MITSIPELDASCAMQEAIALDAAAAKIRRATGRPAPAPLAQVLPLHRGFVEPAREREFAVIVSRPGERTTERTTWATCSLEVVIGAIEKLECDGTAAHARIEVRAL